MNRGDEWLSRDELMIQIEAQVRREIVAEVEQMSLRCNDALGPEQGHRLLTRLLADGLFGIEQVNAALSTMRFSDQHVDANNEDVEILTAIAPDAGATVTSGERYQSRGQASSCGRLAGMMRAAVDRKLL